MLAVTLFFWVSNDFNNRYSVWITSTKTSLVDQPLGGNTSVDSKLCCLYFLESSLSLEIGISAFIRCKCSVGLLVWETRGLCLAPWTLLPHPSEQEQIWTGFWSSNIFRLKQNAMDSSGCDACTGESCHHPDQLDSCLPFKACFSCYSGRKW